MPRDLAVVRLKPSALQPTARAAHGGAGSTCAIALRSQCAALSVGFTLARPVAIARLTCLQA